MENKKINQKDRLKSFQEYVKKQKWKIIYGVLALILILVLVDGIKNSFNTLNVIYFFCKSNIIITLCFILTFIVFYVWVKNKKRIDVGHMKEGKLAFTISFILNVFLLFYRGFIDITPVEKAQIRAEFKADLDSTKKALKSDYRLKEKDWRAEVNQALADKKEFKSTNDEIKASFDSLLSVNKTLKEQKREVVVKVEPEEKKVDEAKPETPIISESKDSDEIAKLKERIALLEKNKKIVKSKNATGKVTPVYTDPKNKVPVCLACSY